jgi:hypothetical protein
MWSFRGSMMQSQAYDLSPADHSASSIIKKPMHRRSAGRRYKRRDGL